MPILTLTLEERRSCWSGCRHFADCYGNKMNWSRRIEHGPALEARLEKELRRLNQKYPEGFVVRLHALGDFYSAKYVHSWMRWLQMFSALRAFGYSSRPLDSGIGRAISRDQVFESGGGRARCDLDLSETGISSHRRGHRLPGANRPHRMLRNLRAVLADTEQHRIRRSLD
jgi:hypothetical protein